MQQRLVLRLAGALAAILAVLAPATPARAHTELVSSAPARDATLAKAPTAVTLTFSERLDPGFTTIVVSDAAARRIPADAPVVDAASGTVTLTRALANGAHTVAYRVVSVDGHTVQGSYTFTVADPARPAAVAAPVPPAGSSPAGGVPTGVLIGLAALGAVLAALAVSLVVSGRRRSAARA